MKKCILIGLLCMSTVAAAAPIDNIVQDAEVGKLTISGTLPSDGEYTVQVLTVDKGAENLDGITSQNVKEIIKTMKVFETDKEEYSVDVVLGRNTESGSYLVRINGGDMTEVYEYTFEKFYNVESIQELLNILKTSDKTEIDNLLREKENRDILGLGASDVYESLSENAKMKLAEKLNSDISGLDSIEKLRTYFNKTCIALGIINAEKGIDGANILKQYGMEAGFSEYEKYEVFIAMTAEEQVGVGERLKGKDLNGADKKKLFNDAVILVELENAKGTADFRDKVESNKEFFEGDMPDEYFKSSDTSSIDTKLMKEIKSIDSLSELAKKIEELMSKPASKPSGSGGGGYSGGVASVTVSTNISETKKFADMGNALWAENAVNYLYGKSIVSGKAEGLFYPNDMVKREEFVKMLVLAFGLDGEGEKPEFVDVSANDWHYPYVNAAYKSGVVKGISENAFGVGGYITRQDMAVMIYRILNNYSGNFENTTELDFTDADEISDYSKAAVGYLKALGVISGMEDGSFKPKSECTRAQAACVIYRALELAGKIKGGE